MDYDVWEGRMKQTMYEYAPHLLLSNVQLTEQQTARQTVNRFVQLDNTVFTQHNCPDKHIDNRMSIVTDLKSLLDAIGCDICALSKCLLLAAAMSR